MRRIGIVTVPGGQLLDIAGPLDVFAVTSQLLKGTRGGSRVYDAFSVAIESGPVTMSSGLELLARESLTQLAAPLDTLMVAGCPRLDRLRDPRLVANIRRVAKDARRITSVCTGAFALAEAGLLHGRRATTHWRWLSELEKYDRVEVDHDAIFVHAGEVWTSAGVSAGIDLALALVEEDFGVEVSMEVARQLVLFIKRPGGQPQLSAILRAQQTMREPLLELVTWISQHLQEDLSVAALAARVGMSPRNFARVFGRQVSITPARLVEQIRVEAARRELEQTQDGIDAIAARCGFGTAETMRRAFLRQIRLSPSICRPKDAEARRRMSLLESPERYPLSG